MANKRSLKQTINLICEELFSECVAASLYSTNRDGGRALLFSVVKMQDDFIRRVSHPEPGMPAKKYFKQLRNDFVVQVDHIIDHINNLA
jgi:hypothetical protein